MIFTTFTYKSTNLQFFKPVQEQRLFKKKKKMQEHDQENREKKETNTFGLVVIFESLFPKTARLTDHHVFLFLSFSLTFTPSSLKSAQKKKTFLFITLSLSLFWDSRAVGPLCLHRCCGSHSPPPGRKWTFSV